MTAELAVVVALHEAFVRWMADARVVEVILAGGSDTGVFTYLLAVIFVAVRIIVVLLLPGYVLARSALFAWDLWARGPRDRDAR